MIRYRLWVALLAGLLLAGCRAGQPDISLSQAEADLGGVVNGEIRELELQVQNLGDADLVVEAVTTSCGCTSAQLSTMTIPAGGRADLLIRFDSGAHGPDEVGPVMRQVFIASNDPDEPELEFRFTAEILPPGAAPEAEQAIEVFFTADNKAPGPQQAIEVFFSAGCADCWPYVEEVLIPALRSGGVPARAEIHDYTVPQERARLLEMADAIELPRSIADSLYAFIPLRAGTLVVLGHVPPELLDQVLSEPDLPVRLVVWQPEMHGQPTEYRLWAWQGEVTSYPIDTPFALALERALEAAGPLPVGLANLGQLLPAVIVTGLLDSVNPCAFAVILLLLAFLFTIRQSRSRILQLGLVYIAMIFGVYFAIGLGILRAVRFSDDPHFVARAGSWFLIGLGGINLAEFFFPRFPIKLHMPAAAGEKTNQWLKQASVPATMGVGLLVGLCTFPCSGGVYVSIITLLNAKTTLGWGVGYLALYNLLFVLPLLVILLAAGNRAAAKRWARWERGHARRIRLWYGMAMVALGAIMLLWVI